MNEEEEHDGSQESAMIRHCKLGYVEFNIADVARWREFFDLALPRSERLELSSLSPPRRSPSDRPGWAGPRQQRAKSRSENVVARQSLPVPIGKSPPQPPKEVAMVLDSVMLVPRESETPELPQKWFHDSVWTRDLAEAQGLVREVQ
jgi:hypothetical protein